MLSAVNKHSTATGVFGFKQRNKGLSYPPSLQISSTDKRTNSNTKPLKTRDICDSKPWHVQLALRGPRVSLFRGKAGVPDSTAGSRSALAGKVASSGPSRKERSGCILKGVTCWSLDKEPQQTQSNDNHYTLLQKREYGLSGDTENSD